MPSDACLPITVPPVPFLALRVTGMEGCGGKGCFSCLGLGASLLDLVHVSVSLPKGWGCFQIIFLTCFLSVWRTQSQTPSPFHCGGESGRNCYLGYKCRSCFQQHSLKAERSLPAWWDWSSCSSTSLSSFSRLPNVT